MPTPPSRRRPITPPATSTRRPKVAGLHRPSAAPAEPDAIDTTTPEDLSTPAVDSPSVDTGAPATPAVTEEESVESDIVSGSVIGADESEDEPGDESDTVVAAKPSPRPAGKRRAAGVPVPSDLGVAERRGASVETAEIVLDDRTPEEIAAASRNRSINWAIALGVVALVFAGLAIWFRGQAETLTGGADGNNEALTDAAATSEVKGQVEAAIEKTLSYNFTDLESTANAVKAHLAGTAVCEYDKLFGQVRDLASAQKLVLTTNIRDLGVTRLEGDKADLLVFVDQSTTRTEQNQTTASAAQFGVRAEKIDGAWKITDFDMLDQPLADGKTAPTC